MSDEPEKITVEVVLAALREQYGEWVVRDCYHKGDKGVLIQQPTGQLFVVTAHEVTGLIVT